METYLDAALFGAEAVSEDTRAFNRELTRKLAEMKFGAMDLETMRQAFVRGEGPIPATPRSPRARLLNVPGRTGSIPLRIIAPDCPRGVYLHMHGGGWVMGAAHMRDGDLERLVQTVGVACVSVDYRLAPEHPYPAAPDDCEAAARWLIANAQELFGTTNLLIGGESAGAHLAAVTLLRLRDTGHGGAFRAANLVFGAYDLSMTPSQMLADTTKTVTTRRGGAKIGAAFVPPGIDLRHPDVSPLYEDLRNLPPALFTIGTQDQLLDDTLFMHARWVAAGNAADLAIYPGGVHGFTALGGALADAAHVRIEQFLLTRLPRQETRASASVPRIPIASAVDRLLRIGVHL